MFFVISLKKKIISKQISGIHVPSECQNKLDPDQAGHNVRPDLGPNCLQRLSADNNFVITGMQSVNLCHAELG